MDRITIEPAIKIILGEISAKLAEASPKPPTPALRPGLSQRA
jgi:hypothetical protein